MRRWGKGEWKQFLYWVLIAVLWGLLFFVFWCGAECR